MARNVFRNGASLYRVIEDAPPAHLKAFLLQDDQNFSQIHDAVKTIFAETPEDALLRKQLMLTLNKLSSDLAEPVEVECRRVLDLGETRGPTSLQTLVDRQLTNEQSEEFDEQPGDLAKSLWAHIHHRRIFDDAVSFKAIRSWRNAGRLFAAFNVDLDGKVNRFSSEEINTDKLAEAIGKKLKTTRTLTISLIDLPEVPEYLPAVLVIVRFAGRQSSVATHGERGERRPLYFLPQDEAILVYTPADERIEVAATRAAVRNAVAECFAVETLGHDVSAKPLTSAVYDTLRFLKSVELPLPDIDGFTIVSARVMEFELRIENWQTRLALKVGGHAEMAALVERYMLPSQALRRALGVSRVLINVCYYLPEDETPYTLELMISDGNNCSLNSERDPKIRNFGRKLLEAWGILQVFRDLGEREAVDMLPIMAELWDLDQKVQKGGYFSARGVSTKPFEDARLIRRKEIEPVLIEEAGDGECDGPTMLDRTIFTIDLNWLEERITTALKGIIDVVSFRDLGSGLVALGVMNIDDLAVQCYLARGLDQVKRLSLIDERLRVSSEGGPGIVFTGREGGTRLIGANIVVPLLSVGQGEINLGVDRDAIIRAFRAGRALARGAGTLELVEDVGQAAARLIFPDRPPLDLFGVHVIRAFRLLVDAALNSRPGVASGDLISGSGSSGFEQMIGTKRWPVVKVYVEQNAPRRWKLKNY